MSSAEEIEIVAQTALSDNIIEKLKEIDNLPTLPTVFLNLMRLTRDPKTSIKEIAKVVESDPAISIKILRLINSAFYGLPRKVDSVQQAIVMLGNNTLKNVIISLSIFKVMNEGPGGSGFDREAFWKHSITCGLIARHLSGRLEFRREEEGFIAGVIHDFGKVVLDKFFHEELSEVIQHACDEKITFFQAELEVLGTSHAEIGAYLAEYWQLPEKLVSVIAHHHALPLDAEFSDLIALVQLADMLATKFQHEGSDEVIIPSIDPEVWKILRIEPEVLDEWQDEVKAEMKKSQELEDLMFKQ
jgi:HD-like signal output (HDOD) protein